MPRRPPASSGLTDSMSRAPLVRLASTTSLSLPAERFMTTYRLGCGPGSARMPRHDVAARPGRARRPSVDVGVVPAVLRLGGQVERLVLGRVATRSLSSPLGDLLVEHAAEDRHHEQAEQHRRGDDAQLEGLAASGARRRTRHPATDREASARPRRPRFRPDASAVRTPRSAEPDTLRPGLPCTRRRAR